MNEKKKTMKKRKTLSNFFRVFSIIGLALFLESCSHNEGATFGQEEKAQAKVAQFLGLWEKRIKGSGNLKSENRQVGTFDKIKVTGSFSVSLIKGKEGKVSITADDNLIEHIVTEVNGNSLNIRFKNKVNIKTYKKLSIVVSVEKVSRISLTGSGNIIQNYIAEQDKIELSLTGSGDLTIPLKVGELDAKLTGSGDISCTGIADKIIVKVIGSGDFEGSELKSKYGEVSIAGSGDVEVYVTEELKATVAGSGDIAYKGNPPIVERSVVGSGDIDPL